MIDLKKISKGSNQNPMIYLLIKETLNFLETGTHNMILDLTDFTPFQQIVFDAVSKISVGNICTYKGLAEALGKPGEAQAVGSAVAKNPVSYFIPTHRVLPQKGIGICRSGAGFLREKLLTLEGHDVDKLRGNYVCKRNKCCME
jgi:O-6-methylguanine DNA methyltransferase